MADGIELGKAYVQIVPSAQGITGSISSVLNGEAASAGDSAGQTVGENLAGSMKKALVASGVDKTVSGALDASGVLKGFQTGFGGVKKRFVAEVAVDEANDAVNLLVARGCRCIGGRLAGKHRKRYQHGQQDRYQFLHF